MKPLFLGKKRAAFLALAMLALSACGGASDNASSSAALSPSSEESTNSSAIVSSSLSSEASASVGSLESTTTVVESTIVSIHEHRSESYAHDAEHHWHVCSDCNEVYDLADHVFPTDPVITPATCTENGRRVYTCDVCGYQKIEVIQASHNTSGEYLHDAEHHWKVCPDCQQQILVADHEWDEGTPVTLPTKFETGLTRYACTICGETKEVVVDKLSDMNLNVLFVGSALIRSNTGFTETFAGLSNAIDGRSINYSMKTELTPGSGYNFKALADETSVLGTNLRDELADNAYDIIILQITRMMTSGHDSVANAELNHLKAIKTLLEGETSQIYLLTIPSDDSYSTFEVDENGNYVKGTTDATTGKVANTAYFSEKAHEFAADLGYGVIDYGCAEIAYEANATRLGLTCTKSNASNYLRGACAYESVFKQAIAENQNYQHDNTNIPDTELNYLKRFAAEYNYEHEHVDANTPIHDEAKHWTECTICSHRFNEANHNMVKNETTAVQASCTQEGFAHFDCDFCGYSKEETYPMVDHEAATTWSKDTDYHWHSCANCDTQLDKAAHTFDQGTISKPATLTEEGEMTYTCTVCGQTKAEVIPMIVHTDHTAAEAYSHDDTHHWHACTFEGCQEQLDKAPHAYEEEVITKATRTHGGLKRFTCVCGATYDEEVEMLGTNLLILGTANVNNYNMDTHLSGLAQEAGYKAVTAEYLTLSSGYSFAAINDTSSDTSYGSRVREKLAENEYDAIIVSVCRMVTKGSDDVIAAEEAALADVVNLLSSETTEIYLMTFNMGWGSTPSLYSVDAETGAYVKGAASTYSDVETSNYFDTLAEGWASTYGLKTIRYSSAFVSYASSTGSDPATNVLKYMQGCILYNSIFNLEVASTSTYHKQISSTYTNKTATNVRAVALEYSCFGAEDVMPIVTMTFVDASWWNTGEASVNYTLSPAENGCGDFGTEHALYDFVHGYADGVNYWIVKIPANVTSIQFFRADNNGGNSDWGARTVVIDLTARNGMSMWALDDNAAWYGNGLQATGSWID